MMAEEDTEYDLSDFQGIFPDWEADRIDGRVVSERVRVNLDFLRLKDLALLLLDPRPDMKVLEIGCAVGASLVVMGLQGAEVTGVDLDAELVRRANQHLRHFGVRGKAQVGDATSLAFDSATFDAVLSSDLHEHRTPAQQVEALTEAHRILRPGGILVIKTPNLRYLKASLFFKRVRAIARGRSPRGFVIAHSPGTSDPQHIGLSTRPLLSKELLQARFVNYEFHYAPLRRFGYSELVELLSTEIPGIRDVTCEELICVARKPINTSHFPAAS